MPWQRPCWACYSAESFTEPLAPRAVLLPGDPRGKETPRPTGGSDEVLVMGLIWAPSVHTDTAGGSLPAPPHLPTAGPIQTRSTPCWPPPPSQRSWRKSPVRRWPFKGQESSEYSPPPTGSRPLSAPVPLGPLDVTASKPGHLDLSPTPGFSRWSLPLRPGADAALPGLQTPERRKRSHRPAASSSQSP